MADRVEERARAVEVDAVALVEIRLGLAGDDGGEVEDDVRAGRDGARRLAGKGEIGRARIELAREAGGRIGRHDIEQGECRDRAAAEHAFRGEAGGELAADHAGRADDQDVQDPPPPSRRKGRVLLCAPHYVKAHRAGGACGADGRW